MAARRTYPLGGVRMPAGTALLPGAGVGGRAGVEGLPVAGEIPGHFLVGGRSTAATPEVESDHGDGFERPARDRSRLTVPVNGLTLASGLSRAPVGPRDRFQLGGGRLSPQADVGRSRLTEATDPGERTQCLTPGRAPEQRAASRRTRRSSRGGGRRRGRRRRKSRRRAGCQSVVVVVAAAAGVSIVGAVVIGFHPEPFQ